MPTTPSRALSLTLADEDVTLNHISDEYPPAGARPSTATHGPVIERPRVLALDLSISATGRAWPDGSLATLSPPAGAPQDDRVDELVHRIALDLDQLAFDRDGLVAIENGVYRSQAAFVLGMLHWGVRSACRDRGIPYLLVTPAQIKTYATGKGAGKGTDKTGLAVALSKRMGIEPQDDNQVDAWWLRALALDLLGWPVLDLPKTHRRALDKLTIPEGVTT